MWGGSAGGRSRAAGRKPHSILVRRSACALCSHIRGDLVVHVRDLGRVRVAQLLLAQYIALQLCCLIRDVLVQLLELLLKLKLARSRRGRRHSGYRISHVVAVGRIEEGGRLQWCMTYCVES